MKHGLAKSLARKLIFEPVGQLHQEVELGRMVWWVVELLEQWKRCQAGTLGLQCDLFAFISCLFQGLSFCFVIVLFSRWQAGSGTMLLGGFLLICHELLIVRNWTKSSYFVYVRVHPERLVSIMWLP